MLTVNSLSYETILKNISFVIEKAGIYALIGANGSGKSTLLKTLKRIWEPSSGEVLWKGESLMKKNHLQISKIMTYLPQNPTPAFPFTVKEFIGMVKYPEAVDGEKLLILMEEMNLKNLAELPINELSGGEMERAYFARAIFADTPVLLLDEPTASLDIEHEALIWKQLKKEKTRGKMILMSQHNMHSVEEHADAIFFLSKGSLQEVSSPLPKRTNGS